jgi:hypothetical protein
MRSARLIAASLSLAAPVALMAQPAVAEQFESEHYVIDEDHIEQVEHGTDFCGGTVPFPVRYQATGEGSFHGVAHGDGLVYYGDSFRVHESFTNTLNGKTLTQDRAVHGKDLSITDNGDGTLSLIFQNSGRTFVYGPDGTRLFIDAGRFVGELLIPDGGTPGDPSDDGEAVFVGEHANTGRTDTAGRDFCQDLVLFLS